MKDIVSDFVGIIENEIQLFCQRNSMELNSFNFNEETDEESIVINFNGFDVHIFVGENLTYGYPLFEDTETTIGYCILPRFKFFFSPHYFSPYDIHNIIDYPVFETLDFHCIRDEADVLKSIHTILNFIETNLDSITDISGSLLLQKQLKENFEQDLSVVSKKITADNFKEDFRKYSEKHELNLYFHARSDLTYAFANTDKYKELDNYLKHKSKKNKLTVFEQRLHKHLEDNGYKPVSQEIKSTVKKQQKENKKNLLITFPSYIIAGILSIVTFELVSAFTRSSFSDGIYRFLGSSDASTFSFFIILVSYKCILTSIAEALFKKKVHPSARHEKDNKKATLILTVLCFAIVAICGVYNYFFKVCSVAIHDTGIFVGTKVSNEIVPFENNKVEFILIEGYTDPESNTYHNSSEDKELYIVVDKDYEDWFLADYENPQELSETLNLLKEKNIDTVSMKDFEDFENACLYNEN